jgi:hypothetical protein
LPNDDTVRPENADSLDTYAEIRRVTTANALFELFHKHPFDNGQWVFRGHTRADYRLQPSLERIIDPVHFPLDRAEELAGSLFRSRAHHYVANLPKDSDELEWLSLMRHHGAPTRLLDWTVSPYVAAFFASCEPQPQSLSSLGSPHRGSAAAIWAINAVLLKKEAIRVILSDSGDDVNPSAKLGSRKQFNRVFLNRYAKLSPLVAPVRPVRMNERLTAQRGLFLCANTLHFDFEAILKKLLSSAYAKGDAKTGWIYKLEIAPEIRLDLLAELRRMNISYASLFPGLDGFARAMQTYIEIKAHLNGRPEQVDDVV